MFILPLFVTLPTAAGHYEGWWCDFVSVRIIDIAIQEK